MFGPEKVILVVGINKVAPDLDSAISRVKHYAAPVNAIRLGQTTPCTTNGLCSDADRPNESATCGPLSKAKEKEAASTWC